jgi:hypothetical protein
MAQELDNFIAFLEKQSKTRLALRAILHPREILPADCGVSVT